MKKVSSYIFKKNKAEISVGYLTPSEIKRVKVDKDDCLCLVFDKNGKKDKIFIRPDEALIISQLLISAVNKTVKAYDMMYDKNAY